MTETRCWKLVAIALLCVSCARASKEASPPPEETSAPAQSLSEIDAYEHDLEVSETRLRTVLAERSSQTYAAGKEPRAPMAEPPPPPPAPARPGQAGPAPAQKPETNADMTPEPAAEASAPRVGSDCDLACRALASMRRAADGICGITGDSDQRCRNAQERVAEARSRVEGAGCRCG